MGNLLKKSLGVFLAAAVSLSAISCASAAPETKASEVIGTKVMDLDLSVTGQKEYNINRGIGTRDTRLSVGDQTVMSEEGFVIRPEIAGNKPNVADVSIDLTKLDKTYTYFSAVVGQDDNASLIRANGVGGSLQCMVIVDGETLVDTAIMAPGDMERISCIIPAGAQTLTMRTSDVEGDHYNDYCDWIKPTLYTGSPKVNGVKKALYSEGNPSGNTSVSAEASIGVRFNVKEGFSEISIAKESSEDKINGYLYDFTYSYVRSLQNKPIATVTGEAEGTQVKFDLGGIVPAGEYVFVAEGLKGVKANGSQYGYYYLDGNPNKGLINVSLTFVNSADSYLDTPTEEVSFEKKTADVSPAEKQRAELTYKNMLADLSSFPSSVNIGDDSYTGFPSPDFTVASRNTTTDEQHHCETTDTTINHKSGLQFVLKTAFYPEYAAFEWTVYVTNPGTEDSPIVSNFYGCNGYEFNGENPTILTNNSDFEAGEAPYRTDKVEIAEGQTVTDSPANGRGTDEAFPYYNLEYGDKGALIAVGWSSTWQTDFEYSNGVTKFSDKQKVFSSLIKPGEVARTPLTAMVLYDGRDIDRARNLWRSWFIDCNMYRDNGKDLTDPFVAGVTSIVYNEMLNANTENQKNSILAYVTSGVDIDVWWMDAGWYPCYESNGTKDWRNTGNWTPDTERFPDKFSEISKTANENGVKTLLWFEPERVGMSYTDGEALADSCVKPEWLIGYGEANESAYQDPNVPYYRQLDIGNDECRAWLKTQIAKVLTEGGISVYREDMNLGRSEIYYTLYNNSHPERTGMTENKCVQGHYDYWKYLIELDQVELLDSCASGGHRLDLESMRLAVSLHPSDYNHNDMVAKQVANFNLASWLPFTGANSAESLTTVDEYTLRSGYRQCLVLQYDPLQLSGTQKDKLKGLLAEWRNISQYYYDDIYQLTKETFSRNEFYSYGYLDRDTHSGFAMVYNRNGVERTEYIKLKGLNEDDTYEISFASGAASVTANGNYLMNRGVAVKTKSSDVLYIKRTAEAENDLTEFNAALEKAKKTKFSIMTIESGFEMAKAIANAEAIVAAGDTAKPVNFKNATEELKKAQKALKMASASESADVKLAQLDKVIDYIGEVNRDNVLDKGSIIEFAETAKEALLRKYPDAVIEKDGVLTAARADYDRLTTVPVDETTYGDVDGDGDVTVTDALMILQHSVGKITLADKYLKAADVDGTAGISVTDALAVLQYAVKKIDKLPIK